MADSRRSEDVYGEKIDRCLYNSLIKFVGGVGVGIVFSALLFKRKPWPVILGGGFGTGMGISDCNHEFKEPQTRSKGVTVPRNKAVEKIHTLKGGWLRGGSGKEVIPEPSKGGLFSFFSRSNISNEDTRSEKSCLCTVKNKPPRNPMSSPVSKPFACVSDKNTDDRD